MTPSEAFGVVVRSVGLLVVLWGLSLLVVAIGAPGLILVAIPVLLVGLWLLRGARAVISFAYPDERQDVRVISQAEIERIRSTAEQEKQGE